MAGPEWSSRYDDAFRRITGLSPDDIDRMHARRGQRFNSLDKDLFHQNISEAFFQYRNDPQNEQSPIARYMTRQDIFQYLRNLGFDPDNDFDWDQWKQEMGYGRE